MSAIGLERAPRRDPVMRLPREVPDEPGLCIVDTTWGQIQPIELAPGVATVGELEVIAAREAGALLVDCRRPEYVAAGTLPGASAVFHEEIVEGLTELDETGDRIVILFCNGPQCTATPQAVARLLAAGRDRGRLRYYRGGLHDWVTLGLPLEIPAPARGR